MLSILYEVESNILDLLKNSKLESMYIDYHDPFVKRIWFQYKQYRVYLHKIFPSASTESSLLHPHPWNSSIRIIKGKYEMGIGHSETNEYPKIDCKLILGPGSTYEMVEKDGWHYVNPIEYPVYSLMVTGELNNREMPIEPKKKFRELNSNEIEDILNEVNSYYKKD